MYPEIFKDTHSDSYTWNALHKTNILFDELKEALDGQKVR